MLTQPGTVALVPTPRLLHTPPPPAGPLTAEQSQQLFQLLDSTVSQALAAQQQQQGAGRPLLALVAGLGRRQEALGALAPVANMAVLARYSAHLTDMLPKQQWAQGVIGGGGADGGRTGGGALSQMTTAP